MKKKKILIITDRFSKSGNGNYLRSYTLYKHLNLNYDCEIALFKKIKRNRKLKYNLIILDLPNKNYNLNFLKKFKGFIISLDHHLKFYVSLNISLFKPSKYAYKNLCSLKYTIIRDEIKKINNKKKKENLVFISIGSSDVKSLRFKIFNIINQFYKKIYLAPVFNHKKKLTNINNKNYFNNMKNCKLAVANGGTTMLELIYLKKKIISLPQTKLEKKFVNYVKRYYKVITNINYIFNKKNDLTQFKQKKGPIDGNGSVYIELEIKKLLKNG